MSVVIILCNHNGNSWDGDLKDSNHRRRDFQSLARVSAIVSILKKISELYVVK